MLKVHKGRYSNIPLVASLAAGLCRHHDSLGVRLVDGVLEEMRRGLEANLLTQQQRRVAQARLLGELYNYRICGSDVIFAALHQILSFGWEGLPAGESFPACDQPADTFRVRLIVTLLDSCGAYFDRGTARRRLDSFLLYFQRYCLAKPALLMDQAFDVADLLEA